MHASAWKTCFDVWLVESSPQNIRPKKTAANKKQQSLHYNDDIPSKNKVQVFTADHTKLFFNAHEEFHLVYVE